MKEGTGDLMNDAKFNSLMDTFDVLMANNYAKDSAIAAERAVTEQKLAEGEIAFLFGGNWDWEMLCAYDYAEKMGMMPVPQNTEDGTNGKLVGGSTKYFFIDGSEFTSAEQAQAAKDFLNYLVYDEAGQDFCVNVCGFISPFSNNTLEVQNLLGSAVKGYADEGNLIPTYDYFPDDHYSVCGATFQKYLVGQIDRAGFAAELETYWAGIAE